LAPPRPSIRANKWNAATFLDRIQARADLSREDAQDATAAVLSVLQEAVGDVRWAAAACPRSSNKKCPPIM